MGYSPSALLTMMDEENRYSRSNGVTRDVLTAQAHALHVPIYFYPTSWTAYQTTITQALHTLHQHHKCQYAVFGDIDIQAHADFEHHICKQ